ncbi:uncharacterized protein RCC_10715 [Ramularia collo-cygni]|uniref:F-box domain-containing protein n=1 Tax=Ramularia collo-cygni TaxID=112498 RepID=A0A2D3V6G8_9PEZI|nr:uncharacterized protein RCC_10715 [Ramularia collo-cygni]CZT24986.1 uncharacterized protein RCC_10715 [Ramularia collo-cygni]
MDNNKSTARERDHLTQLPSELLHSIFSYLLPRHSPERSIFDPKNEKKNPCSHELDKVAATNKVLRSEVNEWAMHFLLSHKSITKFQAPKSATKKDRTTNYLRGRKGLLTWCSSHCVFCGKKSARSAILVNGFRCCMACDKAQWEKITLTDAMTIYGLREQVLLPEKHVNCHNSRKLLAQIGFPRVRYGVYTCQGGKACMFLLEDVKQLATLIHGELEIYMAKREAARVARKAKARSKIQEGDFAKERGTIASPSSA